MDTSHGRPISGRTGVDVSEPELVAIATDASYESLNLADLELDDLLGLRHTVDRIWVSLDPDEELAVRFEWSHPLIEAAIRSHHLISS
jgi:hypothetical protein